MNSIQSAVRLLLAVQVCHGVASADLGVTNHTNGSTVRYPAVLLRGTLDANAKSITATVGEKSFSVVRHESRFKALVQLSEGTNAIRITTQAPEASTELQIEYKPQTNPYYVRMIWLTDSSGDTTFATPTDDHPQEYEARLRTAATLMQTLTAEKMHDIGLSRKTFRLERDENGEIVVHTLKGPEPAEHVYGISDRQWWSETYRWLNQNHADRYAKNVVLAAYTRKDERTGKMKAHTALGGGNLGLFGSASVFSWPRSLDEIVPTFQDTGKYDSSRVHNDSVGRNRIWGLASTTIGATLHEMGHTFGLPHCTDRFGIMTRGFDHVNRAFTFADPVSGRNRKPVFFARSEEAYFAPISATYLQYSRWFQADPIRGKNTKRPAIQFNAETGELKVTAEAGVAWIGLWVGPNVYAFQSFDEETPTKEVRLAKEEILKLLDGRELSTITALTRHGYAARRNVK